MTSATGQAGHLVVIGGCGRVGLSLAILAAVTGRRTTICDVNLEAVEQVRAGNMPFMEIGAEPLLREALDSGRLTATTDPRSVSAAAIVVLVIGTPLDDHLTPRVDVVLEVLDLYLPHLRDGQTIVLRSTVFPGISERVQRFFERAGLDISVTFCPERISQGHAIRELRELPQIISTFSERGLEAARSLFQPFAPEIIIVSPLEAELAKLFSNTYRYIQFAIANQFYTIATSQGADYRAIEHAMRHQYPRLEGMASPGLAAGPCLFKDTMQLAAFTKHSFSLGLAAVWVNEGLPQVLVDQLRSRCDLSNSTVGILGMTFKADSDDTRDSLSYKLRKLVRLEARETLCHDPYVVDASFVPLDELIMRSNAIIVGTPHREYRSLVIPKSTVVVDVWDFLEGAQ